MDKDLHNRCCGSVWCVKDICGLICAVMTWLLILYADFVVLFVILLPGPYPIYSFVNIIIYGMLTVLAVVSHVRAMLTDPVSTWICFATQCYRY